MMQRLGDWLLNWLLVIPLGLVALAWMRWNGNLTPDDAASEFKFGRDK